MKRYFIVTLTMCGVVFSLQTSCVASAASIQIEASPKIEIVANVKASLSENNLKKVITHKKLTNKMVRALEIILDCDPPLAVERMLDASDNSQNALEKIVKLDANLITRGFSDEKKKALEGKAVYQLSRKMVHPVRKFFVLLHDYSGTLSPLVEESLQGAGLDFKESLLYKFLHIEQSKVDTFFDDNVKSKDELIQACLEFRILFGDLEETLPALFKRGRVFLEIHKKQAQEKQRAAKNAKSNNTKSNK